MQIVIDIPKEDWEFIKESDGCRWSRAIIEGVINGIPLPKGHGRLGDLGKIYVELNEVQIEGTEEYKGLGKAKQIVCAAKTMIEADKAESEEV